MDEKVMVSTNALNKKLQAQIEKRSAAPPPSPDAVATFIGVAAAPVAALPVGASFCENWDLYYPKVVSLLGWASWFIPGPTVTMIKSLLAVINNQVIHGSVGLCGPKA